MRFAIRAAVVTLAAFMTALAAPVGAQQYPSRPIRWIVPVPAGATTDIVTRLVAQKMSEAWGQQVVVDNRPGGVFTVGSEIVAKAQPDGYTIGTLLTPHVVNPFVLKNLPYNTERDFTPVSLMVIVPGVMTMFPGVGANNLKDVIALAKAKPGQLNYGSPGQLTSGHLSMEMLNLAAGIKITHIPYKGGAPAIIDLIGRAHPVSDQRSARRAPAHQVGTPESDRYHRSQALAGAARRADFRRIRITGLRYLRVVRRVRSRQDAEAGALEAFPGDRAHHPVARHEREARAAGRDSGRQHRGGVRALREG